MNTNKFRSKKVLKCIQEAGLTLNSNKCSFSKKKLTILGHLVDQHGIYPDSQKTAAVTKFPVPKFFWTSDLLTTAYHSQTNGLAERFNKTLADILSMYVDVEQRNWDTILPFVNFAYNSAKQNTTGISPFFPVHGRDIETPLDVILPHDTKNHADNYVQQLIARAEEARQLRNYTSWTLKQRISDDITRGTDQSITMLAA
ncbi:hypothetical protein AVEN_2560-1 [Araneus ventricosus]|uniref:Integrase catalytic domain-containing protein n=1 Tax=Araneus ventricosus TaxID=182803 RepID=A0A4Y2GQ56_ARAVE|nr:hypothetical protein AVEN_2560-1 [Araneus ventricosus]